jgi:hypothetical protein
MRLIIHIRFAIAIFLLLILCPACFNVNSGYAAERQNVFSTWEGFEVDKCASIWLIRRYIDKKAVFKFFPKGEELSEGIPFDTPYARFRRYHNMSTYESLLKHYRLRDPALVYIGKIIHDIEVNIWEKKVFEETLGVKHDIVEIILNSTGNDEIINRSIERFDSLYMRIKQKMDGKG